MLDKNAKKLSKTFKESRRFKKAALLSKTKQQQIKDKGKIT
jgi:hypothetical protein